MDARKMLLTGSKQKVAGRRLAEAGGQGQSVQIIGQIEHRHRFDQKSPAINMRPGFIDGSLGVESLLIEAGACSVERKGFAVGHRQLAKLQGGVLQPKPFIARAGDLLRVSRVKKLGDQLQRAERGVQAQIGRRGRLGAEHQVALKPAPPVGADQVRLDPGESVAIGHLVGTGQITRRSLEGGNKYGVAAVIIAHAQRAAFQMPAIGRDHLQHAVIDVRGKINLMPPLRGRRAAGGQDGDLLF